MGQLGAVMVGRVGFTTAQTIHCSCLLSTSTLSIGNAYQSLVVAKSKQREALGSDPASGPLRLASGSASGPSQKNEGAWAKHYTE